jgi:superfamily II DNA or RNA helicase
VKLRSYQQEAIDAIVAAQREGLHRVMIVLATGLGKTVCMAAIPRFALPKPDDATLIIVHRDELVGQTIDKLRRSDPYATIAIEKAGQRGAGHEKYVVASVQTLRGNRLEEFFTRYAGRIGLCQIDEAHHAVANGYRSIATRMLHERPDGLLLGVTATPNRADGIGLAAVFEKIVFSRDFRWAINDGCLVPPRCYRVDSATSLDTVETRVGDFAADQLSKVIDTPDRNDIIVAAYRKHTPGMRAIVFCASVTHARHVCAKFADAGIKADWSSGKLEAGLRKSKVAAFRRGDIDVLVNCALYLEGFDVPEACVLIQARPTKSKALLIQMLGRVLRPAEAIADNLGTLASSEERRAMIAASTKPHAIVLDVVDDIRKQGLETIPTLWGLPPRTNLEGETPDDLAERVEKLRVKRPDLAQTIERAIDCEVALQEISAWDPPRRDESVPIRAQYDWRSDGEDRWVLELPMRLEAKYPDGSPVEDFTNRYRQYMAKAKGGRTTAQLAIEAIGYDPESVRMIRESVVIEREDDVFVVRILTTDSGGAAQPRVLGSEPEKNEAFHRCERWIEKNRKDVVSAITARAEWKHEPPKSRAIKKLVELGVPLSHVPATTGDALALASKLAEEKGLTIEEDVFLEATA